MTSPFSNLPLVARPTWTDVEGEDGNFQRLSGTGQVEEIAGFGLGGFGGGGFGIGEEVKVSVGTILTTTWTNVQTK